MGKILDLVVENFSELKPIDYFLLLAVGALAMYGAFKSMQWLHRAAIESKNEAIDTYTGLLGEYRAELVDLRSRNAELSASKADLEQRLSAQSEELADAATVQLQLATSNAVSAIYVGKELALLSGRHVMLELLLRHLIAHILERQGGSKDTEGLTSVLAEVTDLAESLAASNRELEALLPRSSQMEELTVRPLFDTTALPAGYGNEVDPRIAAIAKDIGLA